MDCANGVGAAALQRLVVAVQARRGEAAGGLKLRLINTGDGALNAACGADFVQKERAMPANFQDTFDSAEGTPRCRKSV